VKTTSPIDEIAFERHGGAECFPVDIDGDGAQEILTYQGPAVFGASFFRNLDHVKPLLPKSVSVSAFRAGGERMWTWGEPNPAGFPYVSHSYEACVAAGDIDSDGRTEVVLADGDRVVVLDGQTGKEKGSALLPDDNYYILQVAGEPTGPGEAAIVIKNGECGTGHWQYGEPVLGLTADLQITWGPKAVAGGGHHILAADLNGDGRKEYLIGYCAVGLDGQILWTVDALDPDKVDQGSQHVDYTDVFTTAEGKKMFSIAGSDRIYLVEIGGRTVFSQSNIHCQGTAIGQFGTDSEFQVALYNSPDGPMVLYDPSGKELWSVTTQRSWPMGTPQGCEEGRMHRNRPIVRLEGKKTWIGYADGGWPWGMDDDGKVSLVFEPPENAVKPACPVEITSKIRVDDIGYSYAMRVCDINNDGRQEALIYDRRFMWVYPLCG